MSDIKESSPTLWSKLLRTFADTDLKKVEEAYRLACAWGAEEEYGNVRDLDASYNPRPGRIGTLMHNEYQWNRTLVPDIGDFVLCFLGCVRGLEQRVELSANIRSSLIPVGQWVYGFNDRVADDRAVSDRLGAENRQELPVLAEAPQSERLVALLLLDHLRHAHLSPQDPEPLLNRIEIFLMQSSHALPKTRVYSLLTFAFERSSKAHASKFETRAERQPLRRAVGGR